jgi:hypothetical protein
VDERDPIQVQASYALPGAIHIGRLEFDSYAARFGTDRNKQRNMAKPGANIHEDVIRREPRKLHQPEDVARRSRLIKHRLGFPADVRVHRLFERKHPADQFIEMIVAHATCGQIEIALAQR